MTQAPTVELHPAWTAAGSRGYRYNVTWNGECIVSLSRDPETDLARALLDRGVKGVVTVLDGRTGKPRTRVNIERAAKLRTVDPDRGRLHWQKWKPHPSRGAPPTAEAASLGTETHADASAPQLSIQHGQQRVISPQQNLPTAQAPRSRPGDKAA